MVDKDRISDARRRELLLMMLLVRVNKKGDVFTFAVVHQSHRDILKRSTKFVIRERFRAGENER
jgi:hypothetical protein